MNRGDVHGADDTGEFQPYESEVSKFYEAEPRIRMALEVAGKSHPGLVRPNNEDNYMVVRRYRGREILVSSLPEGMLDHHEDHAYTLLVADGMGGRNFGELASLLAMRTGWELGGDEIKWTVRLNAHEVEEFREKAQVFCQLIDDTIHKEIHENPRLAGMGTTLTLCYTTGPNLFTIHVGDSRAYLYRGGQLKQLTSDHNVGQILVDTGQADPDSPHVQRMRHVLTNVLGGPGSGVKAEIHHYELHHGDRVLLCTDGLNDMIDDAEVAAILQRNPEPQTAADELVQAALDHGGRDNVTVVVANYRIEGKPIIDEEDTWTD